MKPSRRLFLGQSLALPLLCAAQKKLHSFGYRGTEFLLDGQPFQIRSGEMHYVRVPREYWRDRLRKLRAMGLNTVCTYAFWNAHEPEPERFRFDGNLDVAAFVQAAQDEGLWVIFRPGPYSCAEWNFGGFPPWLLSVPGMRVRSSNTDFLKLARRYMGRLARAVSHLQITRGGPILMVQVENEYGSFGNDHKYMEAIRGMIRDAGFDVTLFTSDGPEPEMLRGGTLPDVLSAINFNGDPTRAFESFAHFRQGVPRMVGEYWTGWFDHWGEKHHTTSAAKEAAAVRWMMAHGVSFNLYMFHGGTSFGLMSGANFGEAYQPDVTSYDYDAPLDEAGRPTPKFFVLRDAIAPVAQATLPAPLPAIEISQFTLEESAPVFSALGPPVSSHRPETMERVGQFYGFVLYRTVPDSGGAGKLTLRGLHDYALVLQQGKLLGVIDRRLKQKELDASIAAGEPLDILVENMGRINFGPRLVNDPKGIMPPVSFNGKELLGWQHFPVEFQKLGALPFSREKTKGPAFYRGSFTLKAKGDTFLDMRGWGKGIVWLNGKCLGRYWRIGPQQSLFTPASWLKRGANELVVLDLETGGSRRVQGLRNGV